ncbi:MAG: LytTR family DNA-binding domain-containing protein [Saprospiraceae bacterium]
MTCLALDDEPLALQLLKSYVRRLPALDAQGFFNNPDEARSRLAQGDIELLFLDIQMPDITGLQFLKNLPDPPMVIFTTAFAEYAVEGFNLDAVDYLLKPFDFQRFEKAATKALEYRDFLLAASNAKLSRGFGAQQTPNSLFVKVEYSVVQIPFDDIRYIEGFDDYIKIHTSGKTILTLLSLKNVLEMLPPARFLRVHRSFIVATDKIERVRARKILVGEREIPVGETYLAALKKWAG